MEAARLQRSTTLLRHSRRSRACRADAAATPALHATPKPAVMARLLGQPVLQLSPAHSVIPLLAPAEHSLPFAASLQVFTAADKPAASASPAPQQPPNINSSSSSSSLVELSYVLSGRGSCVSSAPGGSVQQLAPGDSVIALQGAVTFQAAAAGPAAYAPSSKQQAAGNGSDITAGARHVKQQQPQHNAWWQLFSQLQLPFGQPPPAKQQQAKQQQPQQQLVMLQLLLPAELLTGELECHAGHCEVVAQHLPWTRIGNNSSGNGSHGTSSSSGKNVDQHTACELLAGVAPLAEPEPPQQQQHVQEATAAEMPSIPVASHHQQQQQQVGALLECAPSSSSHSPGAGAAPDGDAAASGSAAAVLPLLSQQSALKRALCEVGAFRLPHQTNRLALVFGPHASPAVCLSFGVEVFEPRHVTPQHIHSRAFELFFVLAGRAEGVWGDQQQQQRCAMAAGDVAVFPPGLRHGIDNPSATEQLYCLQMMLPNESFVEFVRSGEAVGVLDVAQLQRLAAAASCG